MMTLPLQILAVCAVFVGMVFAEPTTGWFAHLVEHSIGFEHLPHPEVHGFDWVTAVLGTTSGLIGLGLAYVMYAKPSELPAKIANKVKPLYEASLNKLWVDQIYYAVFVAPLLALAQVCRYFDTYGIDGLVRTVSLVPRNIATGLLQRFQNGVIQAYAGVAALVVVGLLVILVLT